MPGVKKMGRNGREDAIALDDELFRVLPDDDGEDADLDVDAPARGRGRGRRAHADRWDQDDGDGDGLRADRRDGRRGSGRGIWLPLGALLGVAVLGWGAWMVLAPAPEPTPATGDMMAVVAPSNGGGLNELPLIEADPTPYKQEPGDPGGLQVENTDKQVYERVRDSAQVDDGAAVEQLLPGPVRPVAPPEPEPEPTPAPVATPSPAPPAPEPAPTTAPTTPPTTPPTTAPPASPPSTPAVPDGPVAGSTPSVPAVPGAAPPAVPAANPSDVETPAAAAPSATPTAPEEPEAPAAPTESVTAAVESGPQVQLAAFRQRALAQAHWDALLAAHPDLLGSVPHVIVFADLGDRGQFYRLRAGPFGAAEQAQTLCGALKQRDVECLVVRE